MIGIPIGDRIAGVENGLRPAAPRRDDHDRLSAQLFSLPERMRHYRVPGASLAVFDDAAVEWVRGYGLLEAGGDQSVTPGSLFSTGALSKLVTAVVALRLVDEGLLDLDEDVNTRLKSWRLPLAPDRGGQPVTLRLLLSHQAGITDAEGSFTLLPPGADLPPLPALLDGRTPYHRGPVTAGAPPEGGFRYAEAGFAVVELLLEDVTRTPFDALTRELVFEPLRMDHSLFLPAEAVRRGRTLASGHDASGAVIAGRHPVFPCRAAAGLWATPGDLARLLVDITHALTEGGRLLSLQAAWEMCAPQGGTGWAGLGVFLHDAGRETRIAAHSAGGGFRSLLTAYPFLGTGAVVMTNAEAGGSQRRALTGELMRGIGRIYEWPADLVQAV